MRDATGKVHSIKFDGICSELEKKQQLEQEVGKDIREWTLMVGEAF